MREKVYCPDCGLEMQFHPVTSDYTLTQADLLTEEEMLQGILDEFYSCPACGKTVVPTDVPNDFPAMNRWAMIAPSSWDTDEPKHSAACHLFACQCTNRIVVGGSGC